MKKKRVHTRAFAHAIFTRQQQQSVPEDPGAAHGKGNIVAATQARLGNGVLMTTTSGAVVQTDEATVYVHSLLLPLLSL